MGSVLGWMLCLLLLLSGVFAVEYTVTYPAYIVMEGRGGEWLALPNASPDIKPGMLVEPRSVFEYSLPRGTVVLEASIIDKGDPVEVELDVKENDWSQNALAFVDRLCPRTEERPFVGYWDAVYENGTRAFVEILPMETVDCEKGIFQFYPQMRIELVLSEKTIDVVPRSSPVPGEPVTFDVKFDFIPEGELVVEAKGWDEWYFDATDDQMVVTVDAPVTDYQAYTFRYQEDLVDIAVAEYIEDVAWGDIDFRIANTSTETELVLVIEVDNWLDRSIPVEMEIHSVERNGSSATKKAFTLMAKPGRWLYNTTLAITPEMKLNDVAVTARHNDVEYIVQYNSVIRFAPDELAHGLAPPPALKLRENLIDALKNQTAVQPEENNIATIAGIVIAALLFAVLIGFLVMFYASQK